ncbi:polyprenyl synthetase family protein [Corynebacterium argentoratense]|uniref:polyprenyl synthetase family protein n=1 Tax=Corynebacterium argentoratense TaxID=42817 RepID=UPI0028D21A49|nr:polyprenyl synthetase family protein [Corynebacterium argentoratense]
MRTTHSDDTATLVDTINNELRAYLDSKNQQLGSISPHVANSINLLTQFATNGGKRIRPQFAWAAYTGLKNTTDVAKEDDAAALRAFTALELIQACALIHDDIIDSSDTRRGNPTVHKAVETNHQDAQLHGSSRAFGEAVAILVGDLALAWADDMLRDSGVSADGLSRMYQPWQDMRSEVIAGQLLDICLEATRGEDERESEKVNRYKTAAYTIERPLHLGAALAGASEEATSRLLTYGRDIGIAYQLRDDMLGVFGDPSVTGKPAGDDLREGKRTVLFAKALSWADTHNPDAASQLRAGLGTASTPEDIAHLSDLIASTDAVEQVEQRISELTTSGLNALEYPSIPEELRATLRALANQALVRKM